MEIRVTEMGVAGLVVPSELNVIGPNVLTDIVAVYIPGDLSEKGNANDCRKTAEKEKFIVKPGCDS